MRTNFNLIYKTYKSIKILRNAAILLFSVSQTRYTANHENISKPYNNPKANYTTKEKLDLKPCSNNLTKTVRVEQKLTKNIDIFFDKALRDRK